MAAILYGESQTGSLATVELGIVVPGIRGKRLYDEIETDNEYYCDLCEHKSQTKGGLKIHMGRKHEEIPQLDGEVQAERETDDWWENNSTVSLKH